MNWEFFREFLSNPRGIGAIAPSSFLLAKEMVSNIGISSASVIIEYGPGTGAFTSEILARISPDARFFAVENNPKMALEFRRRFPHVLLFEDSVENVAKILHGLGESRVDCIISGLPWTSFDCKLQDRLLETTVSILREGGRFATFAYLQGFLLQSGGRFRRKLKDYFSHVTRSTVVWRNLPPAFVYRCINKGY